MDERIRILETKRRKEYTLSKFKKFMVDHGITYQKYKLILLIRVELWKG